MINEAKFANKLQFDDFSAITTNLKANIAEVRDSLSSNLHLSRSDKYLVRSTLEKYLNREDASGNLIVRVVTGKEGVGPKLTERLSRSTGGLPVEFARFNK